MNLPRISVVVPCYNSGRFISETLDSIVAQDYPPTEIIVIDGASTDGSVDIIRGYEPAISCWISEKDRGQTHALIKGFKRATGEILCWLNADDLLEPGALAYVGRHFAENRADQCIWGDAVWIDEQSEIIYVRREIPFYKWIWFYGYNYIPQPSTFWRRSLYDAVGGLSEEYRLSMDFDLFARFARHTRLRHMPRLLSRFRRHKLQRSRREVVAMRREDRRIVERELGRPLYLLEATLCYGAARAARKLMRTLPFHRGME